MEYERGEVGMAELCRGAGIGRKTGDTWMERYRAEGVVGLAARSRAPHQRPGQINEAVAERLLAIADAASRSLLRCQGMAAIDGERVRPLFEAALREYGLPCAIRTDNGPPFASVGLAGLTPLAVWLINLGIRLDRGRPGHPQDTGRHERLHRTLKAETANPPAATARAQQAAFDHSRHQYNTIQPHEALGQRPPTTHDTPSPRPFPSRIRPPEYPAADQAKRVRPTGAIRWRGREISVAGPLAGRPVGLTDRGDGRWEVAFGSLILGALHQQSDRIVPAKPLRWAPTND